jgi:hypothetical protein
MALHETQQDHQDVLDWVVGPDTLVTNDKDSDSRSKSMPEFDDTPWFGSLTGSGRS